MTGAMQPELSTVQLVSKREILPGTVHFVLQAPRISALSRPGQFVMVQVQDGTDPLLRRPISLCGANGDTVEFLVQVRGRGTRIMAAWEPGRTVSLIGPLGNGFSIPDNLKTAVLVAGGIGAAPLLYLAKELTRVSGVKRTFYFGAKTSRERALEEAFPLITEFQYFFAAEDGSSGFQGFITSAVAADLAGKRISPDQACLFSCGPGPMLKKIAEIAASYGMLCQLSLEARMACGVGACMGCVTPASGGLKRVCADGPVFDSRDIIWTHE